MEAIEAIITRRSVRSFRSGDVTDEQVHLLLTAGMSGPSAANQRPWQFLVLRDRSRLDALAAIPAYRRLADVPLALVVCADLELNKYGDNWIIDCSIAAQNILLASHALGLGSVWLSCHYMEDRQPETRRILDLPEHIVPFVVIPVGSRRGRRSGAASHGGACAYRSLVESVRQVRSTFKRPSEAGREPPDASHLDR